MADQVHATVLWPHELPWSSSIVMLWSVPAAHGWTSCQFAALTSPVQRLRLARGQRPRWACRDGGLSDANNACGLAPPNSPIRSVFPHCFTMAAQIPAPFRLEGFLGW